MKDNALPLVGLLLVSLVGCGPSAGVAVTDAPAGFPDALKNDAFEYYGLGNPKPVRLEIVENGIDNVGTKTVQLKGVAGDKATYTLHQEGGLASQGDITLSLEKDGLYTMSSTKSTIKPHSLEMPGKLEVGGGWHDHTEMADQKITLDSDLKIVGRERVSTPGGTFDDALHVTSTGQGTMNGPIALNTESWYVRGLGAVKQILTIVPKTKGAAKRTVTVQLAAPEKPAGADAPPAASPPAASPPAASPPAPGAP